MSATITEEILRRVFAAGTLVALQPLDRPAAPRFQGFVGEWKRHACRLELRAAREQIALVSNEPVEMLHGRLDGLYRVAGVLRLGDRRPDEPAASGRPAAQTVWLQLTSDTAERRQRRAFYRLPGRWPALIHRSANPGPVRESAAGTLGAAAARAHDLSAGGMLIDDCEALLAVGTRFRATLDLQDGASPLALTALAVRRHPVPAGFPRRWGCRFLDLAVEHEERILGRLHALTRMRLAGGVRLGPSSR
ncbi:MAG: PilZ domain-containing protein [Candidatus Eisenbacteria sp.]|nr:PilZ domain-containing protein [Candidatus Eisenbacteria bacterium]